MRYIILLILFLVVGCGAHTQPVTYSPQPLVPIVAPTYTPPVKKKIEKPKGVYHSVTKGETLWRIAKEYGVTVKEISDVNRLPDISRIEIGQMLFIPGAERKLQSAKAREYSFKPAVSERYFIWPVKGTIENHFGAIVEGVTNKGLDIKAEKGAEVQASKSGVVSFSSDTVKGFGKMVIINHTEGYQTVYAFNDELFVKEGEYVKQGQRIATVGNSGRADTNLLHFEIRINSRPQNPLTLLE